MRYIYIYIISHVYLHIQIKIHMKYYSAFKKKGFLGRSNGKESACNAGNPGLIPGSEKEKGEGHAPGEGHDNPHQYSCLENPMDRGAWWATVHGVTKSQT